MNKRKVKRIQVTWENGEIDTFDCDATFSESINARKKAGFSNIQEWVEYHITWVQYVQELPPVEKTREELEKEWDVALAEKRKNPNYAGTADGRDFFYNDEKSTWLPDPKMPEWVKAEVIQAGKLNLMRAYGLSEEGLKKWIEFEDTLDFGLDFREGYGNGQHS